MKNLLIAGLLLLNSAAVARITQAPNVSVTAAADDADSVAKSNSYIYGWDATMGVNRRIAVDSNGGFVPSTQSAGASPVGVTSTTQQVWDHVTSLTQTVTGPFSVNLTHAAGTSGVLRYRISSITAATAAVLWAENESSTFPICAAEYATGTTPVQVSNANPGTHVHFSPTAATAISATPKVDIWVLKQTYVPVQ